MKELINESKPILTKAKHLVHHIFSRASGKQSGLYADGVFTTDPTAKAEFKRAFANRQVKFIQIASDRDATVDGYLPAS